MIRRRTYVPANTPILRLGGRPPRFTTIILVSQLGMLLLLAFADIPKTWFDHLAMSAAGLFGRFEIWLPLTAPLFHLDLRGAMMNSLSTWVFGSALERWWGQKRFGIFFFCTAGGGLIGGAILGSAAPTLLNAGSHGSSMGMLLALLVVFPQHLIHLHKLTPLKVRTSLLIMGGLTLVGTLLSRQWMDLGTQLTGLAVALLFLSPKRMINEWRARRLKKRFHVVDGGKKDGPRDTSYLN